MWHLITAIVAIALAAILGSAGLMLINPDKPVEVRVTEAARSGFTGGLASAAAYRTLTGVNPTGLPDLAAAGGMVPPPFDGLSWSVSGGRLCLSGSVRETVWGGLEKAAQTLPSGYRVGTSCDGSGSRPAEWPAAVAASAPL